MADRAPIAAMFAFVSLSGALAQVAHAQPVGATAAAPSFQYAVGCESKAEFLSRLTELSGDSHVEQALARRSVDVSIVEVEPDQWTLTVQRHTTAGTQGRVLRDKSCEQLATAARVVLSVWLREESELPPTAPVAPTPEPQAPPPPPTPAEPRLTPAAPAPAASDDRYFKRIFGVSAMLEVSSSFYDRPGAGVTGELWTMLEKLRISVALSYWTSLREWTGETPRVRVQGWDATAQAGIFLFHNSALDLGVMGALSLGWVRLDGTVAPGIGALETHLYLRPTAAGVLLWSFARPFRLRAMLGLTQLDQSSGNDDSELPALYAAAGLDFEL